MTIHHERSGRAFCERCGQDITHTINHSDVCQPYRRDISNFQRELQHREAVKDRADQERRMAELVSQSDRRHQNQQEEFNQRMAFEMNRPRFLVDPIGTFLQQAYLGLPNRIPFDS